mmetsp:Transcript_27223/g.54435  ORF Transcript_27223/g.54435 Transcript_27223/m.54435 type:complete len:253 (+) Transcript_27223:529-1287(+)
MRVALGNQKKLAVEHFGKSGNRNILHDRSIMIGLIHLTLIPQHPIRILYHQPDRLHEPGQRRAGQGGARNDHVRRRDVIEKHRRRLLRRGRQRDAQDPARLPVRLLKRHVPTREPSYDPHPLVLVEDDALAVQQPRAIRQRALEARDAGRDDLRREDGRQFVVGHGARHGPDDGACRRPRDDVGQTVRLEERLEVSEVVHPHAGAAREDEGRSSVGRAGAPQKLFDGVVCDGWILIVLRRSDLPEREGRREG